MRMDKAIEILKDTRNINFNYFSPDRRDALRLGIEALKRIRSDRKINPDLNPYPLPGETS